MTIAGWSRYSAAADAISAAQDTVIVMALALAPSVIASTGTGIVVIAS